MISLFPEGLLDDFPADQCRLSLEESARVIGDQTSMRNPSLHLDFHAAHPDRPSQAQESFALHVDVSEVEIASRAPDNQLLALNDALARFAALEPKQAESVKLRYFVGLTIEEAADILGISEATAKR